MFTRPDQDPASVAIMHRVTWNYARFGRSFKICSQLRGSRDTVPPCVRTRFFVFRAATRSPKYVTFRGNVPDTIRGDRLFLSRRSLKIDETAQLHYPRWQSEILGLPEYRIVVVPAWDGEPTERISRQLLRSVVAYDTARCPLCRTRSSEQWTRLLSNDRRRFYSVST